MSNEKQAAVVNRLPVFRLLLACPRARLTITPGSAARFDRGRPPRLPDTARPLQRRARTSSRGMPRCCRARRNSSARSNHAPGARRTCRHCLRVSLPVQPPVSSSTNRAILDRSALKPAWLRHGRFRWVRLKGKYGRDPVGKSNLVFWHFDGSLAMMRIE